MIDPGKCATDYGWDAWRIGFLNKLNATTTGAARVPISYVVRPDVEIGHVFEDEDEERMYQMPIQGENYRRDNKLVCSILKAACVKSDAWTWIQDFDKALDGRSAWKALVDHHDGTGELNKQLEHSKEEISRLHHKDEKVFPFERYITKLKEHFYILGKDDDEKLTGGRGSARGNQARGRGGRHGHQRGQGNQRMMMNGVDISDPNRRFTDNEWDQLGQAARSIVLQQQTSGSRGRTGRGHNNEYGRGRRGEPAHDDNSARGVGAVQVDTTDNQIAMSDSATQDAPSERGSQNGRRFGRGSYISRLVSSARRTTFDG